MAGRMCCHALFAVAVIAALGCKGKDGKGKEAGKASAAKLDAARCSQLAKACGDQDKHMEKILDACQLAAKTQIEKGCADKVLAVYDCYEKQVCGKGDKVWALEDLRVLSERHDACKTEQAALRACSGN